MDLQSAIGLSSGAVAAGPDQLRALRELTRALLHSGPVEERCPADLRIEEFLNSHFADVVGDQPLRLPAALDLPCHGLARDLSLPELGETFSNEYLTSYRIRNGVLHNPRSDRRTTSGTFHVCDGGLPIAGDKKAVPRSTFVALFRHAVTPPAELLAVPFATSASSAVRAFCSLLLRPIVSPEVSNVCSEKSLEVRFFAPAGLVSNLDFVESIFGNAGDPHLPENDAGLDPEHWTGHSGCVILAPHLTKLTKSELGLTDWEQATERQRRDGMCWRDPAEKYNEGQAFKVTCRTAAGVIVTLIADNYFGYCKKEVKTQISYSANLFGNAEEEHSGGAIAFARYNLGLDFSADNYRSHDESLSELASRDPDVIELQPAGHALDRNCPDLVYVPGDSRASVSRLQVSWTKDGRSSRCCCSPARLTWHRRDINFNSKSTRRTGTTD